MSNNINVKVIAYKKDVAMIEAGYRKHYLHFDNCDKQSALMYFIIMLMNKVNITWPTDKNFWTNFIDFINEQFGLNRDISFLFPTSETIASRKKFHTEALFYSGGKDSSYAHAMNPKLHLVQFISPVYKAPWTEGIETFTTNVDNELFHAKVNPDVMKLEILFPVISKYGKTRMGIEKDSWDYHTVANGFNIEKWQNLLAKSNLDFDSPIKNVYSDEILKGLKSVKRDFVKCNFGAFSNRDNKVVDGKDFCYDCIRCVMNFVMNCNSVEHNFDTQTFVDLKVKPTGAKTYRHFIELRYQAGAFPIGKRDMLFDIAKKFGTLDKVIPYGEDNSV